MLAGKEVMGVVVSWCVRGRLWCREVFWDTVTCVSDVFPSWLYVPVGVVLVGVAVCFCVLVLV